MDKYFWLALIGLFTYPGACFVLAIVQMMTFQRVPEYAIGFAALGAIPITIVMLQFGRRIVKRTGQSVQTSTSRTQNISHHPDNLTKLRSSFLAMTQDDDFPPERHHRLYQWCKQVGIDWAAARNYLKEDAKAVLGRRLARMRYEGKQIEDDLENLQSLRRRLGVTDEEFQQLAGSRPTMIPAQPIPILPPPIAPIPSLPAPSTPDFNVKDFKKYMSRIPSPNAFEAEIKHILEYLGWQRVEHIGGNRDRGIDLRGYVNGELWIVQCKHYPGRNAAPREVRELVGALHIQRAAKAVLISSGDFTSQCYTEAHHHPVLLWNLDNLAQHIRERMEHTRQPFTIHSYQRPYTA